ncbi:MAG: ARMT1-like domain-containing protein [Desulfurococcales archaeon]|nr:ARMT1-like domain-containing protein [Desulfurococcales archaeon]
MLHARPGVLASSEAQYYLENDRTLGFVESYARMAGQGDPLEGLKRELNERVLHIASGGLEFEDYRGLLEVLAAANGVDWGMKDYTFKPGQAGMLLDTGGVKWIGDPVGLVEEAESVAIVVDNAGEAVIDLLAARWLVERGHRVVMVARSLPYEVDVTAGELRELAARLGVDVEVYETGGRLPVFHPSSLDSPGGRAVRDANVILSKGIANFEAALENTGLSLSRLVFLLRAKCRPIASWAGVSVGVPLVVDGRVVG